MTLLCLGLCACWTASLHAAEKEVWFAKGRLIPQAIAILDALRAAESHGLRAEDYEIALPAHEVDRIVAGGSVEPALLAQFDAALSASAARFVEHLHRGRVTAREAGFNLPAGGEFDAAAAVRKIATATDVARTLASYEPRPLPYRLLKQALPAYRNLARSPGLSELPDLPRRSIEPNSEYAGAPQLRRLLAALGDLDLHAVGAPDDSLQIDDALVAAVRRFQYRHGLETDGVIGPHTFSALTTPLSHRVLQIELTLERWRWTNAMERPDIVVNIPQYTLYALPRRGEPGVQTIEMRVIVGETYSHTRTPIFLGEIQHVIFQPFWDVPSSITRRELLPLIRKNPSYLDRHNMEIVRGAGDNAAVMPPTAETIEELAAGNLRLRQRPGPGNALGPVKFVLPNPYNVYLHATPQPNLFERARRAFSHGCIRVSEPAALAAYVLQSAEGNWDSEAIEAAMCDAKTRRVNLKTPVRVMIFYGTVAVSESAGVMFFDDLYGYDRKLDTLLTTKARRAS